MRWPALLVFGLVAGCATAPTADTASPKPSHTIVGGYSGPIDLNEEMAKAAKAVAVDAIYKRNPTRALVEKTEAEIQVVAGLNYRFEISMTGGATYRIVVYRDLQGQMSVTSYEKLA